MNEDLSILLAILIIHWVIIFIPALNTGKWRSVIINFSLQVIYASYFIYGLAMGEPSSILAYYIYFTIFIVIHVVVNSIQLFVDYSKIKKTRKSEEINIYDWVTFWNNYSLLISGLKKEIDRNELSTMRISVDGTAKGWMNFRQSFQDWIIKHKQSLNENEIRILEKLLAELVTKTDLINKFAL
jgi:hypothetical protein